jgi:hypothetical protein
MRELIHRRIVNVKKDKFMISNLGTMVTVEMPEESFTLEDIQFAKKGIAKEIGKYFPEVTTVQFMESHVLKQPEKVEAKPEEKKAEPVKEEAKPAAEPVKEEAKPAAKEALKETEKPAPKGGRPRKKTQPREQ